MISHSGGFPYFFFCQRGMSVVFLCFLWHCVEQVRVTLFGSFLDLEHVTFFVCQYCGFMVSVQFLKGCSCSHVRCRRI